MFSFIFKDFYNIGLDKVINYQYTAIYLTGIRKADFGRLASVQEASGRFRSAGVLELGIPPAHKQAFREVSRQLITGEDKDFVCLEPRLKATVKFRNWTKSGMLRSPEFVDFVLNHAG